MAGGKKKRLAAANVGPSHRTKKVSKASKASKASQAAKEDRRAHKLARRKEKKLITPAQWNTPAPSHLVAKLDVPRIKSKYQSYFEFAENSEKQDKKLEFQVTDQITPTAGYAFVPIGDPELTQKCKELSRERDAMIFIVSNKGKEEGSKISEHIYRIGYHFRETIVEEARDYIGETVISKPTTHPGFVEPIPETQEEINKQADGAIRDLFPRIPNTDRQMIIEHAFKKGGMFHGEPTVGLQSEIPLSRRVQLAVLAHIRHTHTRYDKLLRETTWMNARKVVEPVCLDVLIKWRGDEETGRDQLDEILREVVIITDSEGEEGEDDSSDDEDTSDDEGEVTSASSTEPPSNTASRNQQRPALHADSANRQQQVDPDITQDRVIATAVSDRTRAKTNPNAEIDRKKQKGFSRYQAAYQDAMRRRQGLVPVSSPALNTGAFTLPGNGPPPTSVMHGHNSSALTNNQATNFLPSHSNRVWHEESRYNTVPEPFYSHPRSPLRPSMHGNEVNMRSQPVRATYQSYTQPRANTPSYVIMERPPQVVRGSPARHNPQDMPLPSIETSSNFASPRAEVRGDMRSFNHAQDPFPRREDEQRLQSPPRRQVIVIDDSPQVKRRRVIREDDVGHFRKDPVSSHGEDFYVEPHSRSDSHFMPPSSAESRNFFVRHPPAESHTMQGLSRSRQPVFIDPITSEELPVYDDPAMENFAARHPPAARPAGSDYMQGSRTGYSMQQAPPLSAHDAQGVVVQPGFAQYDRALPIEQDRKGGYPNLPESSQYHDMRQNSVRADRDLVDSFSQSRLDGSAVNNDFIVLSDRGHRQGTANRVNPVPYYDEPGPHFVQQNSYSRARSPARYIQRVTQQAQPRRNLTPQHQQHDRLPPGPGSYAHSSDPRRRIIVLD